MHSNWRFHVAAEVSRSCNGVIFQMSLGISRSRVGNCFLNLQVDTLSK